MGGGSVERPTSGSGRALGCNFPALLDCLLVYDSVSQARQSIDRHLSVYDALRSQCSIDRQTPDEAYFSQLQLIPAAA